MNRPAPAAAVFGACGPQLATTRYSSQGFTQPRRHRRAGPFSNSLTLGGGIGVAGSLSIDPGTAAGVTRNLGNQIHDDNGPPGSLTKVGDGTLALRKRLIRRSGASAEPMGFGTVRAWLDRCDGTRVAGCAQDKADPDATVCLDIVVDGRIVAMTVAAISAQAYGVTAEIGHHSHSSTGREDRRSRCLEGRCRLRLVPHWFASGGPPEWGAWANVEAGRVYVDCATCRRSGRDTVASLIDRYGADISTLDLLRHLTASCRYQRPPGAPAARKDAHLCLAAITLPSYRQTNAPAPPGIPYTIEVWDRIGGKLELHLATI